MSDEGGGEGWREGDRGSVCQSASQLTFPCSATFSSSVQPRIITSLYEILALSRITEESVCVGEVKCHHSPAGGIKGAAVGSTDGADGEGADQLCVDSTKTRPSPPASMTELNSSKLPPM